jgi:hypothetical protein
MGIYVWRLAAEGKFRSYSGPSAGTDEGAPGQAGEEPVEDLGEAETPD